MTEVKKKKKSIPKALRMKLWEKEFGDTLNGNCFTCHRNVKIDDFQAGHIIAEVNSGELTLSNLKVVCKPCNTSCGTMDLALFKQSLETKLMPPPLPRPVDNLSNLMFGANNIITRSDGVLLKF